MMKSIKESLKNDIIPYLEQKIKSLIIIPQLFSKLTENQRSELFNLLKKLKFIPELTDRKSFFWAFGGENKPEHWEPIKLNFSAKHGLRILLTPILGTITEQHIRDIEKLFLNKKDNPFKMGKDEYRYTSDIKNIESILTTLKIEKANWYSSEKKPTSPTL